MAAAYLTYTQHTRPQTFLQSSSIIAVFKVPVRNSSHFHVYVAPAIAAFREPFDRILTPAHSSEIKKEFTNLT